jgi:2-oxoglutarate ferredoxin oxidoreductase subunit delta
MMTERREVFRKLIFIRRGARPAASALLFAPVSAITRDEAGYPSVDEEKCIRCGWCEIRCPDFAITVERKKEEGMKVRGSFDKEGPEGTPPPGE